MLKKIEHCYCDKCGKEIIEEDNNKIEKLENIIKLPRDGEPIEAFPDNEMLMSKINEIIDKVNKTNKE